VGVLGAIVTVIGWFVVRWREDRIRGIERELKYRERQIEEFYGPLFSLMHQILVADEIQMNFVRTTEEKETTIRIYFRKNYFAPLHEEMIQILKAKLYLVEGTEVPPSFKEYLSHACDDRARSELAIFPKDDVKWPTDFKEHLTLGLKTVKQKYDDLIYRLQTIKSASRSQ
jgi:hypothetical protein